MVRQTLLGVEVDLGDGVEPCETTIQAAGGYVVVVESLVAGANALLVSSYLAEFNGRTAVSDLTMIGSGAGRVLPADGRADGRRDSRARVPA